MNASLPARRRISPASAITSGYAGRTASLFRKKPFSPAGRGRFPFSPGRTLQREQAASLGEPERRQLRAEGLCECAPQSARGVWVRRFPRRDGGAFQEPQDHERALWPHRRRATESRPQRAFEGHNLMRRFCRNYNHALVCGGPAAVRPQNEPPHGLTSCFLKGSGGPAAVRCGGCGGLSQVFEIAHAAVLRRSCGGVPHTPYSPRGRGLARAALSAGLPQVVLPSLDGAL
jgi:hypothetical protein